MVAVGALVASLLAVVPTTSARADAIVPFPDGGSATGMLADSHGHVFVTAGATLHVLSSDGATLYVSGQAGISAIDTTSLIVTRVYPMAACTFPMSLAFVGAALWFAGARCGYDGPIGTLALDTGTFTTIAQSTASRVVSVPGDSTTLLTYSDSEVLTRWAVSGTAATSVVHTTILANGVGVDPVSGDVL